MSFGADIGAIWRSGLDTESKAILTAIRYYGNDSGVSSVSIQRIVAMSGVSRRTLLTRLSSLVESGWLVRDSAAGKTGTYTVHQCATRTSATDAPVQDAHQCEHRTSATDAPVQDAHQCEHRTSATDALHPCEARTTPVRASHQSPTPPNKVFEISSGFSPDQQPPVAPLADRPVATRAPAPAAAPDERGDLDLQSTIEAYRCGMAPTRGGGRAQFLPSGLLAHVQKLHSDFGGLMVRQAIDEAIGAKGEIPSPNYLRSICQRMRDNPGGRVTAPSTQQRRPGADPGVFRAKGPVAPFIEGNPDEAFGPRLPEDHKDDSHAL